MMKAGLQVDALPGLTRGYRLLDARGLEREVIYQENFIDAEACDTLIRCFEANAERLHRMPGEDKFFDGRFINFGHIPATERPAKAIMQAARRRIAAALQRFYGETEPLYSDTIQLVKWDRGQPMPPHMDNAHPDGAPHPTPHREFASVVYLNDDFLGGYLYFDRLKLALAPRKGALVAFRGGAAHRHGITEVLDGVRYTMPAWSRSPPAVNWAAPRSARRPSAAGRSRRGGRRRAWR